VNEIVPLVGGLIVGLLLPLVPGPRLRLAVGVLAAFAVGLLATVVSGEYRIGWEYLLFDVPLAGLASVGSYLAVRRGTAYVARRRARLSAGDSTGR
jgi:hypothetical protein